MGLRHKKPGQLRFESRTTWEKSRHHGPPFTGGVSQSDPGALLVRNFTDTTTNW